MNVPAARDQLLEAGWVLLESRDCDVRWSLALGSNSSDGRTTPLLLAPD